MSDHDLTLTATRRQPQQMRSRLLVASIREACRRILREGDAAQLTAKRIAEVAGVTIGSFYQYFPNKEAVLLDILLENAPDEAERITQQTRHLRALRAESLERTLRELIDITCERHLRLLQAHGEIYRRHHREIDFEGLMRASVRRYVEVRSLEDWVMELLEAHAERLGVASLEIASALVTGCIVDMTARAVDGHPEWLSSVAFRSELLRLLLHYLERDLEPSASAPAFRPNEN